MLPPSHISPLVALDFSGRSYLSLDLNVKNEKVGGFDTELLEEFLQAFAREARLTLHVKQLAGTNTHHIFEAVFKGLARAISAAVKIDEKNKRATRVEPYIYPAFPNTTALWERAREEEKLEGFGNSAEESHI